MLSRSLLFLLLLFNSVFFSYFWREFSPYPAVLSMLFLPMTFVHLFSSHVFTMPNLASASASAHAHHAHAHSSNKSSAAAMVASVFTTISCILVFVLLLPVYVYKRCCTTAPQGLVSASRLSSFSALLQRNAKVSMVLALVLGIVLAAKSLMLWHVWCAYPRGYHELMCERGGQVTAVLDAAGIKTWAVQGSLLAYGRHPGFPIPWEHDLDLGMRIEDVGAAMKVLAAAGFEFEVLRGGSGIAVRFDEGNWPVRPQYYERDGEPKIIDLFGFGGVTDEFLAGLTWGNVCLGRQMRVQKDIEGSLKLVFGPDWRTPKFEHMSPFCAIYVDS
eukprot:ANDGO_01792.mRNA.1 hypothetical protein